MLVNKQQEQKWQNRHASLGSKSVGQVDWEAKAPGGHVKEAWPTSAGVNWPIYAEGM